jgi:hypothetical protein
MGKPTYRQANYGPQRALTLKSRLFVLLRDELGLGRQPKVARLLVDEILAVIEDTFVAADQLEPGQVLLLAPEIGQGPSWRLRKLEDKKLKALRLSLVATEDLDRLVAGERHVTVRLERMVRLVHQAYEQGATLTSTQLALLTGVSPGRVSEQLRTYCRETGKALPTRGVIEDCSPAVTHKAEIVARHLAGESTAEIARTTHHTPRSVERYLRRFEQVRELVAYLDRDPEPECIARILGCSERLVRTYLELLPGEEGRPQKKEPV